VVLEVLGYTSKEKQRQDGGMLPVEQADDLPARVRQPSNNGIALLEVWIADAEMTEGRVPRDK